MCGELKETLGVDDIIMVAQRLRLRWYGQVLQQDENHDCIKICTDYEVEGVIPRGRAKKTWTEVTEKTLSDPTNTQGRCYRP